METLKLKVKGMTCSHCEMTVSNALKAVSGVKGATADRSDESAEVSYKEGKVVPAELVEAVKEAGYEASLE